MKLGRGSRVGNSRDGANCFPEIISEPRTVRWSCSFREIGGACMRLRRRLPHAGALATSLTVLVGCAMYSPQPLPQRDDLASRLAASAAPQGPVGLNMNAVATLAVLNNPNLKAARATMNVAAAQAFAAGILPDPQFSFSADHPNDHVTSRSDPRYPEYNAYGLGLAIDLRALLTHASTRAAADAAYRQAQADLLWQEWQTVAEARTQYVAQSIAAARIEFLAPAADQYALAAAHSARALAQANVTLEQAGADQAAVTAIRTQLGVAQRATLQAEQALRTLLGVRPEVTVPLQPLNPPMLLDRAEIVAAMDRLPQVRPDLRALQEGYRSQEAQVRIAVLSQFPNIVVGITRARDVSDVHTTGGTISLDLPLFDRGQGNIAIQRATRAQLRAEYQARLDQASADTWHLWNEMQELHTELGDLDQRLPLLHQSVDSTQRSFAAGNLPAANYLALINAYLAAQGSRFDLLQSLWSDSIALAAVTGAQVQPTSDVHPDSNAL
jgi:outer membrane protein TolC